MVTKYQKSMGRKNIMYKGPETEYPDKEQRTGQQAELWAGLGNDESSQHVQWEAWDRMWQQAAHLKKVI